MNISGDTNPVVYDGIFSCPLYGNLIIREDKKMSKFGEVNVWHIALRNGEATDMKEAAIPLWKSIVIKHYLSAENFGSLAFEFCGENYEVIFDSDKNSDKNTDGNSIIVAKIVNSRYVDIGKPDNGIIQKALALLNERAKSKV